MQSSRWCYTLNNYNESDELRLQRLECKYHVYGRERGEQGTDHLQGFVIFSTRKRFTAAKSLIGNLAHIEVARGASHQAADYCKKDGDYFEFGTPPSQGKRTDWDNYIEWCKQRDGIPTQREIILEYPALWARYHQRCLDIAEAFAPSPKLVEGEPRPGWQQDAYDRCLADAHPRTIEFFVDPLGNKGKSWFAAFMLSKFPEDVQCIKVGKEADMCYSIDESKTIFIIDVPRSKMEFFQYSVIEQLKDRMVFSTKYNSRMKIIRAIPHVLVMCNESPDRSKLSQDRFTINWI